MAKYRGFSTIDRVKKFRLVDLELAKRDLFNHFQIRKGEKLMQPNFGSIIWNVLFEPLTEETKTVIREDVEAIVGYDPRLRVNEVVIKQLGDGLLLQVSLFYVPTGELGSLSLTFDKQSNNVSVS